MRDPEDETSDPGDLRSAAEHLSDPSTRDTNLDALEVIAELLPGVGGFLSALIGKLPRERRERQMRFVRTLADEVYAIRDEVDSDFVRSEEFEAFFEEVVEKTAQAKELEKRDYYAAALANTALPGRPSRDERERMIDVLGQLRPAHLRLLALVATTHDGAPENLMIGGIFETIRRAWPDAQEDQVRMDWADLAALNVLQGYPSGMMSRQGVTDLTVRLTDFGRRFHAFITTSQQTEN